MSLAGPATNAVIAAIAAVVFIHVIRPGLPAVGFPTGAQIVFYIGLVNVWLCIFNLIPIPPLDGSALLERLLPLLLHLLRPLHFLFPCLVQTLHQLLAGLHLILQLCLGDCLEFPVARPIRDFLLLWRHLGVIHVLGV